MSLSKKVIKVLIIRLSAMGDTIHSLPVAAALKKAVPGIEISWLVEPLSKPLLTTNPAVDRVFTFRKQEWLSAISKPDKAFGVSREVWKLVSELRAQHFDIAIDLQGLFKSALFLFLSGAKRRIGFSGTREGAELFTKEAVNVGNYFAPDQHVVELNLKLADYIIKSLTTNERVKLAAKKPLPGAAPDSTASNALVEELSGPHTNVVEFPLPTPSMESRVNAQDIWEKSREALSWRHNQNVERRTDKGMVQNVVLIPGTTWATKLWGTQRWCQLISALSTKRSLQVCLIGGQSELEVNSYIESCIKENAPQTKVINLTGKTDLLDLIALFNTTDLVLGVDTGPLHLAAATGNPIVIGLYGATPWRRNGPYGSKCHSISLELSCQPCFEKFCHLDTIDCLKQLSVETVLKSVEHIISTHKDSTK